LSLLQNTLEFHFKCVWFTLSVGYNLRYFQGVDRVWCVLCASLELQWDEKHCQRKKVSVRENKLCGGRIDVKVNQTETASLFTEAK